MPRATLADDSLARVLLRVARLVLLLRERCGWSVLPAYAVGVLLNNFSILGGVVAFMLCGPNVIFEPDFRLPQEGGLDATGRKLAAFNIATIITALLFLAIVSNYKV